MLQLAMLIKDHKLGLKILSYKILPFTYLLITPSTIPYPLLSSEADTISYKLTWINYSSGEKTG